MHQFQAFTRASKKHRVLPNNLTGPDHLDTDLCIRTPTNHPSSSIDSHVIQSVALRLCYNSRHTQGGPTGSIDFGPVVGFQYFDVIVRPQ
jgi:hypothetical protein